MSEPWFPDVAEDDEVDSYDDGACLDCGAGSDELCREDCTCPDCGGDEDD